MIKTSPAFMFMSLCVCIALPSRLGADEYIYQLLVLLKQTGEKTSVYTRIDRIMTGKKSACIRWLNTSYFITAYYIFVSQWNYPCANQYAVTNTIKQTYRSCVTTTYSYSCGKMQISLLNKIMK